MLHLAHRPWPFCPQGLLSSNSHSSVPLTGTPIAIMMSAVTIWSRPLPGSGKAWHSNASGGGIPGRSANWLWRSAQSPEKPRQGSVVSAEHPRSCRVCLQQRLARDQNHLRGGERQKAGGWGVSNFPCGPAYFSECRKQQPERSGGEVAGWARQISIVNMVKITVRSTQKRCQRYSASTLDA